MYICTETNFFMKKLYFILAAILFVGSVKANVISGNFSICLPGPNTSQLFASLPPAPITATTPWFSSNSSVATINSSGLVTGLSFGTTTISYTDNLGSIYSVNVNVSTFPTINAPNGTSICEAGIVQLQGSLFPNEANAWESLNTGIATVNSSGLVTGVAAGTVNILYRNLGGCTTTIPIVVKPSLVPIITCGAITPSSITFNWNALPGASTYVRYSQLNGGPITSLGSDAPFTLTISNLSPEDQVTFYVVATGTAGNCFQLGQASCSTTPCPDAGTNGSTTICETSTASINLFSLISGEDSGGTWTRISGTGGVFNDLAGTFTPAIGSTTSAFSYSILGTAPCPNDTSIATININQQPDAGTDGFTTICDSSVTPIDLFSLITGEQVGGIWTRMTGTGGVFNAALGTFTPVVGATTSTFRYRIIGIAPCVDDFSVVTVNINAQPNAGTDGGVTICDSSEAPINLFDLINGEQLGGTWTRNTGTGGTLTGGIYTPASVATTSTFSYTLTGTAPCVSSSSTAAVTINPQPNAGTDGATQVVCDNSTTLIDLNNLITGEQAGGIWTRTGTGGTFDSAAGTFIPTGATNSTFRYTLTGTFPCVDDFSEVTVTINAQPNAGTDGGVTICDSSEAPINLFDLINGEQLGGTWTRNTGTGGILAGGIYTPTSGATTSAFTYTLTGTAPCVNSSSIATVNINAQPNAGTDGATQVVCDNSTTLIDLNNLITGEQAGGIWTRTGTGGTFDSAAGTFIPTGATNSTFRYTVLGFLCADDFSEVTVTINTQPNAGVGETVAICDSSTTAIDLFSLITSGQTGGVWTQIGGTGGIFNALGTFTPTSGATTSNFTYTLTGTAPCVNSSSIATLVINNQPNAGTDGCISVSEESTNVIDLFSLLIGGQIGGSWTRTSGAGGTFSAVDGTYFPAIGATTSTFEYSTIGTFPCTNDISVATIVINGPPCGSLSATIFETEEIGYYPNPFTDVVNIDFSQPIRRIKVVNVLGQQVFLSNYNEANVQANLSHLSAGSYFMIVDTAINSKTFKVIKN